MVSYNTKNPFVFLMYFLDNRGFFVFCLCYRLYMVRLSFSLFFLYVTWRQKCCVTGKNDHLKLKNSKEASDGTSTNLNISKRNAYINERRF